MQSSINAGDTSQQVELQGIERVARLIAVTGPWLILALAVALPALLLPPFLTTTNITNVMLQAAIYVPLVVGMTYVITGGGIDLSIGSQVALCGVIMASMLQGEVLPLWLVIILTLALGALLGAINGIVISVLKIPDFIVTLAFMEIYRGLALVHSAGHIWYGFSDAFRFIGSGRLFGVVPMSLIIVVVVTVIAGWAYQRTYFGRYSIAIGGNRESAAMAGIKVWQLKVQQYGFLGAMCGLAAILLVGRLDSAQATMATGYEIHVIAATIIGGTALFGGRGNVWGSLIGALILALIANTMILMRLDFFWRLVATGVIILVAVSLNQLRERYEV